VFFLNFFAYTSMSHYSEDSKKNLTVELVILCKNWLILSDANNSFVPHLYSQRNCTETLISLCFGPTGISQLCDQLENIGWTSSVMSLKKILAKIFAKNIGRVSSVMSLQKYWQKYLPKKLAGSHRWWVSNWPEMTVGGTIRLWLFIFSAIAGGFFTCGSGLDWKGGEWSSAKGLVALRSIFSLNLVFGVANRGF